MVNSLLLSEVLHVLSIFQASLLQFDEALRRVLEIQDSDNYRWVFRKFYSRLLSVV